MLAHQVAKEVANQVAVPLDVVVATEVVILDVLVHVIVAVRAVAVVVVAGVVLVVVDVMEIVDNHVAVIVITCAKGRVCSNQQMDVMVHALVIVEPHVLQRVLLSVTHQ